MKHETVFYLGWKLFLIVLLIFFPFLVIWDIVAGNNPHVSFMGTCRVFWKTWKSTYNHRFDLQGESDGKKK